MSKKHAYPNSWKFYENSYQGSVISMILIFPMKIPIIPMKIIRNIGIIRKEGTIRIIIGIVGIYKILDNTSKKWDPNCQEDEGLLSIVSDI